MLQIHHEQERLDALHRYDVLDTPREEAFDRITRLVRKTLNVPIALVSVIDGHRQWHKSCDGLRAGESPREQTFCTYTIQSDEPLVVEDAATDPRFASNPNVIGEPHIRAYAGVPLRTADGHNIGTLCVIDVKPRRYTAEQIEVLSDFASLAMHELDLRLTARVDSLTGSWSRRAFKDEGERATRLAMRHHHDLSCVALDLDHFKRINDLYGHAAGDLVLQRATQACMSPIRRSDIIGRVGGEEFGVLLPFSGREGALQSAERMRAAIAELAFDFNGQSVRVTASFGVASLSPAVRDFDELMKRADSALYEAKALGRNRCVVWRGAEPETKSPRRRVLKGGQILFNDHKSIIDCTVRSLSEDGAGIDVFDAFRVPKMFDLLIKADRIEKPCRVVSKTDKHLEVEFS
ncbi:MAG: sensor domain-containing diguanylate cyclase [Rhizobiales bacterium]|nr:sensor domain-containing diguanylate cyclase [Hyphomicrobiales bacterium]